MNYPQSAQTDLDKLEFAYAAQEKLRAEHNSKGADFRNGVITEDEFRGYLRDRFKQKKDLICSEILRLKSQIKSSTRFTIDLDTLS